MRWRLWLCTLCSSLAQTCLHLPSSWHLTGSWIELLAFDCHEVFNDEWQMIDRLVTSLKDRMTGLLFYSTPSSITGIEGECPIMSVSNGHIKRYTVFQHSLGWGLGNFRAISVWPHAPQTMICPTSTVALISHSHCPSWFCLCLLRLFPVIVVFSRQCLLLRFWLGKITWNAAHITSGGLDFESGKKCWETTGLLQRKWKYARI